MLTSDYLQKQIIQSIMSELHVKSREDYSLNMLLMKKTTIGFFRTANSKACAQEIEEYFLEKGMDGDTGGGNDDSTVVYCYKKNGHTNP